MPTHFKYQHQPAPSEDRGQNLIKDIQLKYLRTIGHNPALTEVITDQITRFHEKGEHDIVNYALWLIRNFKPRVQPQYRSFDRSSPVWAMETTEEKSLNRLTLPLMRFKLWAATVDLNKNYNVDFDPDFAYEKEYECFTYLQEASQEVDIQGEMNIGFMDVSKYAHTVYDDGPERDVRALNNAGEKYLDRTFNTLASAMGMESISWAQEFYGSPSIMGISYEIKESDPLSIPSTLDNSEDSIKEALKQ